MVRRALTFVTSAGFVAVVKPAVTAAAVAAIAWLMFTAAGQAHLSPGPLRGDHVGNRIACEECHTPFVGVPDKKCAKCHEDVSKEQVRLVEGLHSGTVGTCVTCHPSHRDGRGLSPTQIDHTRLRFTLEQHRGMKCAECHGREFVRAKAELCNECHLSVAAKMRSTKLVAAAAARLQLLEPAGERPVEARRTARAEETAWYSAAVVEVERIVERSRRDAVMSERGSAAKGLLVDDMAVAKTLLDDTGDAGISPDAARRRLRDSLASFPEHLDEVTKAFGTADMAKIDCVSCHVGGTKIRYRHGGIRRIVVEAISGTAGRAAAAGLPAALSRPLPSKFLGGKHAKVTCAGCHEKSRYVLESTACKGCHEPLIHGRLKADCNVCHTLKAWKPAAKKHDPKLEGAHSEALTGCLKCHGIKRSTPAMGSCSACHAFRHRAKVTLDCRSCHGESRWKPSTFAHSRAADCYSCHSVQQSHYSRSCQQCHRSTTSWRVITFAHNVVSSVCSSCHGRPRGHYRAACNLCHKSTSSWSRVSFSHSGSSRCSACHWKPRGHYSGSCSRCHSPNRAWRSAKFVHGSSSRCLDCHARPRNHYSGSCSRCHSPSRAWKSAKAAHPGASSTCTACHRRPAGHFSSSCSRCHATGLRWKPASFSHPRVGPHTSSSFACSRCHPNGYATSSCTACHSSNDPGGDDD